MTGQMAFAPAGEICDLASFERVLLALGQEFGHEIMWWRGHADATWSLKPHVFRPRPNGKPFKEVGLINHFKMRAAGRLGGRKEPASEVEWLFLAQHYGLPTRLLDWTENPLAALYFALHAEGHTDCDACLWAASPTMLNVAHADPTRPGGAQRGFVWFEERPIRAIAMLGHGFTAEAIRKKLFPDEPQLRQLPSVVALGAVELDERIVAQSGRFTIHAVASGIEELRESGGYLRKFVIPASEKNAMAYRLQMMGIRSWNLFPDLQRLAEGLKLSDLTGP